MIRGVPETEGEDLYTVFIKLCNVIGVVIERKDIDILHRVPTRLSGVPQPIVVRLVNRWIKIDIINKRKKITSLDLGYPHPAREVFVGDHLTSYQQGLLGAAKDKCNNFGGRSSGLSAGYSWGKVRIKCPNNPKPTVVKTLKDIENLLN